MNREENICPECGNEPELIAKDFHRTSHCSNNHTWHTCLQHGTIVSGYPEKPFGHNCTCEKRNDEYVFTENTMDEIFQVIHGNSRQERKTILQMLGKLAEECGEVAEEILIKDEAPGMAHKNPGVDGVLGECVDTMIVAACIAFKDGASIEDVRNKFVEKLNKWKKVSING